MGEALQLPLLGGRRWVRKQPPDFQTFGFVHESWVPSGRTVRSGFPTVAL